jgi:hypothetical protein
VQTLGGNSVAVWNNETVATSGANQFSHAVALKRSPHAANVMSMEINFAADPGAFAIDLQVADTDADKYYVTKSTLNTGLNAGFTGRVEVTNLVSKFARLKMVSRTNSVACTAKLT